MSRTEHWKDKPWRLGVIHRHEADDDPLQAAWQERVRNPKRPRATSGEFSTGYLTQISKEIVYCMGDDRRPTLQYVTWGVDFGTAELTLDASWLLVDPDRDDLLRSIGFALAYEVPVVPDTVDLAAELEAIEREVLGHGFTLKSDGRDVRLINTPYARVDIDNVDALEVLNRPAPTMPTEVRVLMSTMRRELASRAEAGRVLASLRLAIQELDAALDSESRNEADLQQCLTRHPILFGPEYSRLVPEFGLGADFRMDFALIRASGLADLVEIEASTHPVFTKKGNPSAALVHAEQQVLDWLAWLDRYGELARRDLPELQRPVGYVVIGRDRALDDDRRQRLQQRNLVFGSALQVLTWDGLRRRAATLLRHLAGLSDG